MGRQPIGPKAMSNAQKQKAYRERLEARHDRIQTENYTLKNENRNLRYENARLRIDMLEDNERELLIKLLNMLGSSNGNERDNAAKQIEKLRKKIGRYWDEIL